MNSILPMLIKPEPPWVVTCQRGDALSSSFRAEEKNENFLLIEMCGEKIKSLSEFYELVSYLFSFPDYFGENLNALIDCMEDEKLETEKPLLIAISSAECMLIEDSTNTMHGVISTFNSIGERWSSNTGDGTEWGSPPRGFLVVFEYS